MKWKDVRNRELDINIHFWLGEHTSTDEAGVAAYKSVELDDYLGGFPVQHREVQGHESAKFLSYFRKGMRLLEGGVASGFTHVEKVNKPRLFHIKGKRIPVVKECPEISWKSMNSGDVFILDALPYVFLWTGKSANYMEKIQGAKVAQQFKGEHGPECNSVVITEEGTEKDMRKPHRDVFEKHLPLNQKNQLQAAISDVAAETKGRSQLKLYRCSDESGKLKVIEVKDGPLVSDDLDSKVNLCYSMCLDLNLKPSNFVFFVLRTPLLLTLDRMVCGSGLVKMRQKKKELKQCEMRNHLLSKKVILIIHQLHV